MIYEFTDDTIFVTKCLTTPSVWRMGSDDSIVNIKPKLFFAKKRDHDIWLKTERGVFIINPRNDLTCSVHIALLPEARGMAAEICKGAINYFFKNTKFISLDASIPEYNHLAIRLARNIGMEFIGINEKSFQKNGALYAQHLFVFKKGD